MFEPLSLPEGYLSTDWQCHQERIHGGWDKPPQPWQLSLHEATVRSIAWRLLSTQTARYIGTQYFTALVKDVIRSDVSPNKNMSFDSFLCRLVAFQFSLQSCTRHEYGKQPQVNYRRRGMPNIPHLCKITEVSERKPIFFEYAGERKQWTERISMNLIYV